jgi:hypothetical protein
MKTLTAKNPKQGFSRVIDLAPREAVRGHQNTVAVVRAIEEFERLKALAKRPTEPTTAGNQESND